VGPLRRGEQHVFQPLRREPSQPSLEKPVVATGTIEGATVRVGHDVRHKLTCTVV
jgi:hypothetical protein